MYYATFSVNRGTYSVSLHIQSKCGKKSQQKKSSEHGNFQNSGQVLWFISLIFLCVSTLKFVSYKYKLVKLTIQSCRRTLKKEVKKGSISLTVIVWLSWLVYQFSSLLHFDDVMSFFELLVMLFWYSFGPKYAIFQITTIAVI